MAKYQRNKYLRRRAPRQPSKYKHKKSNYTSKLLIKHTLLYFLGIISAFFVAYSTGILNFILPTPQQISCSLNEWYRWNVISPILPEDKFVIVLLRLRNDPHGRQTDYLRSALQSFEGVEVVHSCRVLAFGSVGAQTEIKAAVTSEANAILSERKADFLIWGDVVQKDSSLRIGFINNWIPVVYIENYNIQDAKISKTFSENVVREAVILSLFRPLAAGLPANVPTERIQDLAAKTEALIRWEGFGKFSWDTKVALLWGYAKSSLFLSESLGTSEWLERSIYYIEEFISDSNRPEDLDLSMPLNLLGLSYQFLAELNEDPALAQRGVNALRESLESASEAAGVRGNLISAIATHAELLEKNTGWRKVIIEAEKILALDVPQDIQKHTRSMAASAIWKAGFALSDKDAQNRAIELWRILLSTSKSRGEFALYNFNLATAYGQMAEKERNLELAYMAKEHAEAAILLYTKKDTPRRWFDAHLHLAIILEMIGDFGGASGNYSEALRILDSVEPRDAEWAAIVAGKQATLRGKIH